MSIERRERRFHERRFKKFMNKKWNIKLWSIPQPHVHTCEGRGYDSLYHFTCGDKLNDILKYGIIFGDVMMRDDKGFNSPCLTTEGHKHNPSMLPDNTFPYRDGLIRLTVDCPQDQDKLINLGWFDNVYCHKYRKDGFSSIGKKELKEVGEIDKQYFYLGHIEPSKISGMKIWDEKTKKWERIRRQDKEDICSKYETSPFPLTESQPNHLRIMGLHSEDYSGMVNKYTFENDHKDIYKGLYQLSDFICYVFHNNLDNPVMVQNYEKYKELMWEHFEKPSFTPEDTFKVLCLIIDFHNFIVTELLNVEELKPVDMEKYLKVFMNNYGNYKKWLVDYRKSLVDEYVKNHPESDIKSLPVNVREHNVLTTI